MRAHLAALAAGLLLLSGAAAFAQTRPAAPVVTVGANLKEITFNWDPVPGAVIYRVLEKVGDTAYFRAIGERLPSTQTSTGVPVAVHLQAWNRTRYVVLACNSAGCTRSDEIFPRDLMLDTIGYVKASNTGAQDNFGRVIALSSDGSTMAVTAEREASNASGVDGDQANDDSPDSGAVYVYRRIGRRWAQEAYLKSGDNEPQQFFGTGVPVNQRTLSLSADGSMLAVGAPSQSSSTLRHSGAVFVFTRSGTSWRHANTLRAPTPMANDYFGTSVDLSHDGQTLKVTSLLPTNGSGEHEGRTHIYSRTLTAWARQVTLAPHYAGDRCVPSRLSGDGLTLVTTCHAPVQQVSRAITHKLRDGDWVFVTDQTMDSYSDDQAMALNYHGTRVAISQYIVGLDACPNTYVTIANWNGFTWDTPSLNGGPRYAAVCADDDILRGRARTIEFDKHGNYMAFTDFRAPAAGAGVAENIIQGTEPQGSVYLLHLAGSDPTTWSMRSHVKAPNPGLGDDFGRAVALSGNGRILAIGAVGEDSAARGIDGNQDSEAATDSGAVYLY